MMQKPPAVILAGGRSSRMGGGDKGLLPFGAGCLLTHVQGRLAGQAGRVALNANGDPARFADLGLPVLPDSLPDQPGPLAGVLAALDWAAGLDAASVLTVAGDTPFLPPDLTARLSGVGGLALAASPDDRGVLRDHPTIGLWPTGLRHDLRDWLCAGQRRVRGFTQAHGATRVIWPADPVDPFYNVNTPAQMDHARSILLRHDLP